MKKIGLTQRIDYIEAYDEHRDSIDRRWYEFIEKLDCIPSLLPNLNHKYIEGYLDKLNLDGVILTGGNNISKYSQEDDYISLQRDIFETKLLSLMIKRKTPVIGICRGMQLIQTYFGGNLIKVENHVATRHKLKIESKIYPLPNKVNSYHSWGISSNDIPEGFLVLATDELGNVEAFINNDLKILGIMWHPEREKAINNYDVDLIKGVIS